MLMVSLYQALHVLWVDAAMHYLSEKHLPFAITAYLTLFFYISSSNSSDTLPLQSI